MTKKKKNRNLNKIEGGYVSSLAGISQTDRAELYKLNRRGAGTFENKKRKATLKPKHKKGSNKYCDSCAYFFAKNFNKVKSNIKITIFSAYYYTQYITRWRDIKWKKE